MLRSSDAQAVFASNGDLNNTSLRHIVEVGGDEVSS